MRLRTRLESLLYLPLSMLAAILLPQRSAAEMVHPADEEIRRHIQEILGRAEFGTRPRTNLWLQFVQMIADLVGWLGGLRYGNPVLFWLLVVTCSTLLTFLCVHIAWTIRRVLFVDAGARHADAQREKRE